MSELLNYLIGVIEYIPTNIINLGVISYLLWFGKTHTKEHKDIMSKVNKNEESLKQAGISYSIDRELMLKGLITNDNLPNFVRLDFYKQYKEMGGNSWVETYVSEHILCTAKNHGRRYNDGEEYKYDDHLENGHTHFKKQEEENK